MLWSAVGGGAAARQVRWHRQVMAQRSKRAKTAVYIKWDGDERAAASTLDELDAKINRVQLFQFGSWTPTGGHLGTETLRDS